MSVRLRHTLGAFELDAAFEFGAQPGVTALFGPSGAGKSTVLNAIAGLLQPAFGRIVLGGETLLDTDRGISVPARLRRIGVVFQDTRLFPHLTVRANLLYGWQRTRERVEPAADRLRDRAARARAIARAPSAHAVGRRKIARRAWAALC